MKTIIVKTQAELDALPDKFDEYTVIEIRSATDTWIKVTTARESSQVEAWESSRVEAWGSSQVVARESSRVEAWGSSQVVARGSSQVVARESSQVEAWGSSQVVAHDYSMIAVLAATVVVKMLLDYSVASCRGVKPKIVKRARTATVIHAPDKIKYSKKSFIDRCELDKEGYIILYKSVDPKNGCDYKTGKIKYEGVVTCPDWNSDVEQECGNGLHLSPTPGAALSYHPNGTLLRCRVKISDFVVYPWNITKVRCRRVEVIGPVDKE